MTTVPGIFVAGDAGRGQSLIVWAIAEGRAPPPGRRRRRLDGPVPSPPGLAGAAPSTRTSSRTVVAAELLRRYLPSPLPSAPRFRSGPNHLVHGETT